MIAPVCIDDPARFDGIVTRLHGFMFMANRSGIISVAIVDVSRSEHYYECVLKSCDRSDALLFTRFESATMEFLMAPSES